LITDSSDNVD